MTAWSYKHLHNYPASFAVDRNVHFNAFSSWPGETYPWLALDLHYPRLVSRIIIIENDNTSLNIEARVGYLRPFYPGQKDGELYTYNSLCGEFPGPSNKSTASIISCWQSLEGRYVSLQSKARYNILQSIIPSV